MTQHTTTELVEGRLRLVALPGAPLTETLVPELDALVEGGATVLLTLVTDRELEVAGLAHFADAVRAAGLRHLRLPIVDMGVPEPEPLAELVAELVEALDAGEHVVVHCLAGKGRSGTVAGCVLVARGHAPDAAVRRVRQARPGALETPAQVAVVHGFVPLSR